jgi:hypothetical protein
MRNFRRNCIEGIKDLLKSNKKMSVYDLKVEIMKRFTVSEYTAQKYIKEIVMMGVARLNDDHVIYIFDQADFEKKKEKKEAKHE